jgi:replicative DNA helicase
MISLPERHPPYAPEAEISVLGAMLIDNVAVMKVLEILDESMFYRGAHQRIFRGMVRLFQRGLVVDPPSIADTLKDSGELEQAGGLSYLAEMLDSVPTAANVEYHAKIVKDRAIRRRAIEVMSEGIKSAYEPGNIETDDLLESVQSRLFGVASAGDDGSLQWVRKSLMGTFERIETAAQAGGGITGVPSGLMDLDEMTGGFQKADLIVVAARPSMGKSALVTGIALHAAITAKVPVAFFSL